MKKLNEAVLLVGDIILTTTPKLISKSIRKFTKSDISHAMIYVDGYSVIDATSEGVQARNTQRLFYEESCSIHVLRCKNTLSSESKRIIVDYARQQIGVRYSITEAFSTITKHSAQATRKQFCSRLVAQAFQAANICLVEDVNYCTPENLKQSSVLFEVSGATVTVSEEDVRQWDGHPDINKTTRNAINTILDGARKKSHSIEELSDIDAHLISHPDDDDYICKLFVSSGYLDIWKTNAILNPWQTDLKKMEDLAGPKDLLEKYCRSTLSEGTAGRDRFSQNRDIYLNYLRHHALATFKALADLYSTLSETHSQRRQVAEEWLRQHSDEPPASLEGNDALKPHSRKWFDDLRIRNPHQALVSKIAVDSMGRSDICSICGDDPANDYVREMKDSSEKKNISLCLCDDCLATREIMFGEIFLPFSE